MTTKTKAKKAHKYTQDPVYGYLNNTQRSEIDKDAATEANWLMVSNGLRWGIVALVGILIVLAFLF